MGSFYSNVVVFGADEAAVIDAWSRSRVRWWGRRSRDGFEKGDDDGSDPIDGRARRPLSTA